MEIQNIEIYKAAGVGWTWLQYIVLALVLACLGPCLFWLVVSSNPKSLSVLYYMLACKYCLLDLELSSSSLVLSITLLVVERGVDIAYLILSIVLAFCTEDICRLFQSCLFRLSYPFCCLFLPSFKGCLFWSSFKVSYLQYRTCLWYVCIVFLDSECCTVYGSNLE